MIAGRASVGRRAFAVAAFFSPRRRRRLANSGRPRYETAGRWCRARHVSPPRAAIAQLVEHLIRNEGVGGSNPSCGTIFSCIINTLQTNRLADLFEFVVGEAPGKHHRATAETRR